MGNKGVMVFVPAPRLTEMDEPCSRALAEGLRAGIAVLSGPAGALNVTRHGLGTGRTDAVQVLTERVRLTPVDAKVPA